MEESIYFRHCDKPTISPKLGHLTGKIPTWLNGTLIRNGGGIRKIGKHQFKHMFDGLAVLHRFHIEDGIVTYNNIPLESEAYKRAQVAQRIVMTEFGTVGFPDPCDSLFNKFKSLFIWGNKKPKDDDMTDNCGVSVGYYGDQCYAMTETVFTRRIDPTTLKTIGGRTRIGDYVTVNTASAHPHILPDGNVLNMGANYRHIGGPHYCIIKVPPTFNSQETCFSGAKIIAEIPASSKLYPSYFHSFGMTLNKIIFIEQPLCISTPQVLKAMISKKTPYKELLTWFPNTKTKFHVISMETGERHPIIYETDDLFTFHHANAYEEDWNLIVDVVGYDNADIITTVGAMKSEIKHDISTLRRYVLPLDSSNISSPRATLRQGTKGKVVDVKPKVIYAEKFELPRINYKFNGRKYEFVYGVTEGGGVQEILSQVTKITKVNVSNGNSVSWEGGENTMVSEPVFVPNPSISNPMEDDGVILCNLLHKDNLKKTTFVVIDAKDMKEIGRVEFQADGVVTSTLHGQWAQTGDKFHYY